MSSPIPVVQLYVNILSTKCQAKLSVDEREETTATLTALAGLDKFVHLLLTFYAFWNIQ